VPDQVPVPLMPSESAATTLAASGNEATSSNRPLPSALAQFLGSVTERVVEGEVVTASTSGTLAEPGTRVAQKRGPNRAILDNRQGMAPPRTRPGQRGPVYRHACGEGPVPHTHRNGVEPAASSPKRTAKAIRSSGAQPQTANTPHTPTSTQRSTSNTRQDMPCQPVQTLGNRPKPLARESPSFRKGRKSTRSRMCCVGVS
jgi:hypothetical protein